MTVHRFLVTSEFGPRMDLCSVTGSFANWIEGRRTRPRKKSDDRETWIVTCYDQHAEAFLSAARQLEITVEDIHGAGDHETYELLVGEPGSGWAKSP